LKMRKTRLSFFIVSMMKPKVELSVTKRLFRRILIHQR
jgi:hypothetical protein